MYMSAHSTLADPYDHSESDPATEEGQGRRMNTVSVRSSVSLPSPFLRLFTQTSRGKQCNEKEATAAAAEKRLLTEA